VNGFGPVLAPEAHRIKLTGEEIEWRRTVYRYRNSLREVHPGPRALVQFLGLADAPKHKIHTFALKYGVLGLCIHKVPICHRILRIGGQRPYCVLGARTGPQNSLALGIVNLRGLEPLSAWRSLAREAGAIIKLQQQGVSLTDKEYKQACEQATWLCKRLARLPGATRVLKSVAKTPVPLPRSRLSERLSTIVNEWLGCSGISPRILMDNGKYRFAMTPPEDAGPNLFAYLAIQLALALTSQTGVLLCAGCGAPFTPTTPSSPQRRNFCRKCQKAKKAQLFAMRKYRGRRKQARDLRRRGYTLSRIAMRLKAEVKTIQGWVA
jgi:hypothetical protein